MTQEVFQFKWKNKYQFWCFQDQQVEVRIDLELQNNDPISGSF